MVASQVDPVNDTFTAWLQSRPPSPRPVRVPDAVFFSLGASHSHLIPPCQSALDAEAIPHTIDPSDSDSESLTFVAFPFEHASAFLQRLQSNEEHAAASLFAGWLGRPHLDPLPAECSAPAAWCAPAEFYIEKAKRLSHDARWRMVIALVATRDNRVGHVYVDRGTVLAARCGEMEGAAALESLGTWEFVGGAPFLLGRAELAPRWVLSGSLETR